MRHKNIDNDPAYLFQYVLDVPYNIIDGPTRDKKRAADVSHYRCEILQAYSLEGHHNYCTRQDDPVIMGSIYNGSRLWR